MIGHEIVVTVLEVRGDQVRLGIQAPQHVQVHREEVFAALQQANREAASPSATQLGSLDELSRSSLANSGSTDKAPAADAPDLPRRPEIGDSRPG